MALINKDFRIKNGLIVGAGSGNELKFPASAGSAGETLVQDANGNLVFEQAGSRTLTVTVGAHPEGGNAFYLNDVYIWDVANYIQFAPGIAFRFDQSDSSNAGHPLAFSETVDGTHGFGAKFTAGITQSGTPGTAGAYTEVKLDLNGQNLPNAGILYPYCEVHSGMANTTTADAAFTLTGNALFLGGISVENFITEINIVDDTTPQLGATLDAQDFNIFDVGKIYSNSNDVVLEGGNAGGRVSTFKIQSQGAIRADGGDRGTAIISEGAPIQLFAGNSTNTNPSYQSTGGRVQIHAGDAGSAGTRTGGYVEILSGSGADTDGYISLDGIKYPKVDGTSGQVLVTDGAGNLSFATVSAGGTDNYVANGSFNSTTNVITLDRTGSLADITIDLSGAFVSQGTAGDIYVANAEFVTSNNSLVLTKSDSSAIVVTIPTSITSIDDLTDVDISTATPTNGQVLVWENTKFVPGDVASSVSELTDVDLTGLADNSILRYDSTASAWVISSSPVGTSTVTAIDDLTDVDTSGVQTGYMLVWDGNSWIATTQPTIPTSIDDFTDVNISGVSDGDMLVWDSVNSEFIAVTQPSELDTLDTVTGRGASTTNTITVGGVAVNGNITATGDVTVDGDLRVNGTTTTVNSTEVTIADKNIVLGSNTIVNPSDAIGAGISVDTIGAEITWDGDNWYLSDSVTLGTGGSYKYNGEARVSFDSNTTYLVNQDVNITGYVYPDASSAANGTTGQILSLGDSATGQLEFTSSLPVSVNRTEIIENPNVTGGWENDRFGDSVILHGDYMIVASPGDDDAGQPSSYERTFVGSVSVYDLSKTQNLVTPGALLYTVHAPNTTQDRFGNAIAVYGSKLIVSEYLAEDTASNAGKVYVYDLASGTLLKTLSSSSPVLNGRFGHNITASEGGIIVLESGATKLYSYDWDYNLRSGFPIDITTIDSGISTSKHEISAHGFRVLYGDGVQAYVFDMRDSTAGSLLSVLPNSQFAADQNIGNFVDINERYIAVTGGNGLSTGSNVLSIYDAKTYKLLHVFEYGSGIANAKPYQQIDTIGYSVDLHNNYAMLAVSTNGDGTPTQFRIDVFDLSNFKYLTSIENPDFYASAGDDFAHASFGGKAISLHDNRVAVGAPLEDLDRSVEVLTSVGKVYIFELENVYSNKLSGAYTNLVTKLENESLPALGGDLQTLGNYIKPGDNNYSVDVLLPQTGGFYIRDEQLPNNDIILSVSNSYTPVSGLSSKGANMWFWDETGTSIQISGSTGSITLDGALTASGLAYPTVDGSNGQVLSTDGNGNLSFTSIDSLTEIIGDTSPQLGGNLDTNGNDITNSLGRVTIDGIAYPDTDGTANQVLSTDGAGNLGFTSVLAESAIETSYLKMISYEVTVAGSKFVLDGVSAPSVTLVPGLTHKFDLSDPSCSGTEFKFSGNNPEGPNASYTPPGGSTSSTGTEYTVNVTSTGTPGTDGAVVEIYVSGETDKSLWYYNGLATGYGNTAIVGSGGLGDVVSSDLPNYSWRAANEPIMLYGDADALSKNVTNSLTRPTSVPLTVYSANTAMIALTTTGNTNERVRQANIYQQDDTGIFGVRTFVSDNRSFAAPGGIDTQTAGRNDLLEYQSGQDWNSGTGSGPFSSDEKLSLKWSNGTRSLVFKGTGDGELRHSNLRLLNDYELRLGDNNEFKLKYDSSSNTSIIEETGTGGIKIKSNDIRITTTDDVELLTVSSGGVILRGDNTTALYTSNGGIVVPGNAQINGTVTAGEFVGTGSTVNVVNTPTTINAFLASTDLTLAATSGATTIRNNLNVGGGVVISGDLTVSGTTTTNTTSTVSTEDSLLILNSPRTGYADLGLVAGYTNLSDTQVSTGLFHDATDGIWKLFDDYTPLVSNNATINTGHASFNLATLEVGELIGSVAWDNITSRPDPIITLNMSGDVSGSGSVELTNLQNGTLSVTTTIPDNSDLTFANLEITGDLVVNGTTTTTNQQTLNITDSKIFLAANNNSDAIDAGIIFNYSDVVPKTAGFFRDATDKKFKLFDEFTENVDTTINTGHASFSTDTTLVVGTVEANVTGNLTGNVTGDLIGSVYATGDIRLGSNKLVSNTDVLTLEAVDTTGTHTAGLTIDSSSSVGVISTTLSDDFRIDRGRLQMGDQTGRYIFVKAPTSIDANYNLTLPPTSGNLNDVLVTDGSGALTFKDSKVSAFSGDKTFEVTVTTKTTSHRYHGTGDNGSYILDGVEAPEINFEIGATYTFDLSDATCDGYQLAFYYDAAKTNLYNTDVIVNGTAGTSGAFVSITVNENTPSTLHYQATSKVLVGGPIAINTRNFTGLTSDNIPEGVVNEYYSDSKVDSYLSGGTGVSYLAGEFSIGQAVGTGSSVQFGNVTLQQGGLLTLSGSGTITTPNLNIVGNDIVLNSSAGSPSANASIIVNRGSETDAYIRFDEGNDEWVLHDGNTEYAIITSSTLSAGAVDATTFNGELPSYYLNYNNLSNTPQSITSFGIVDGSAGQVLTTDGSGGFSFTTVSGSGGDGTGAAGYLGMEDYFFRTVSPTSSFGTSSEHNKFQVFVNGVLLDDDEYAANTSTGFVSLSEPTMAGDEVMIYGFNNTTLENHELIEVDTSGNLDVPGAVTIKDDRNESLISVTSTFSSAGNILLYDRSTNPAIGSKLVITITDNSTGATQISEALILDAASESTGQITTYGTLYTGASRLCSFDLNRTSSSMFLVCDVASTTNSTTIKIAQTFIT